MKYRYDIHKGFIKTKTKTHLVIYSVLLGVVGLLMATTVTLGAAHAASPNQTELAGNSWRVYNAMPATAKFWDINPIKSDATGVQFKFQKFQSTTTGSFAVYLKNNYNNDLTGKTITANVNWTPGIVYTNRGTGPSADAYVRIEFQDVASGNYTSNDYWWYSGSVADLNSSNTSATLIAPLKTTDPANWTNVCDQAATDTTAHPGSNCVGGTDPAVSPYDGFINAMKDVKQVNLSFGRASRYASGVAAVDTNSAIFDLTSFTIK